VRGNPGKLKQHVKLFPGWRSGADFGGVSGQPLLHVLNHATDLTAGAGQWPG